MVWGRRGSTMNRDRARPCHYRIVRTFSQIKYIRYIKHGAGLLDIIYILYQNI